MKNNNLACQCLCTFVILFGINHSIQANNTDWMLVERFKSVQQQARDGKVQAMYDVGRMYERGRGTAVNFSQAAEWYQKASAAGNAAAKARLGILYFEGRGVTQNHQQAYRLLNEAARANIPSAQYQLGLMYEWGTVVNQDKHQAMQWYEKAMQGGDYRAKDKLAQLRSQQGTTRADSARHSTAEDAIPTILNGKWHAGTRPAGILPSSISQCEPFNLGLKCHAEQQRSTGAENITYKTEATISTINQQHFSISYYNTVLKVTPRSTDNASAEEGSTASVSNIKVGQKSPEHKLDCQIENKNQIRCNKDNVRNYSFSSR